MSAPKFSKEFNVEHAKAGAPYCCRDGREATVLKWDCRDKSWPIVGVMGNDDTMNEWSATGGNNDGIDAHLDLIMLPLGMIDGKPVFVGDDLLSPQGTSLKVKPDSRKLGDCTWPAPAKVYPATQMTGEELYLKWARHDGDAYSSCVEIANAALRHACDAGQVVSADHEVVVMGRESRTARDMAIAIAIRGWYQKQFPGMEQYVVQPNLDRIIAQVKP